MPELQSLRVGYVVKRFPRFSETFIVNEILALERAGVHVEVFSLREPDEPVRHEMLDELRAPVHQLSELARTAHDHHFAPASLPSWQQALHDEADSHPIWAGRPQAKIAGLRARAGWIARRALQSGLTHLHAHFGSDATSAAMLAARAAGIGYSFTAHARDIYHGYVDAATDAAARRHKISQARFVATVTEFNRRHLVDLAHGQSADIRLLYNGIDLQRFRPDPDRITGGQRILAIGRLVAKKGFGDLIDACALLRQRGIEFRCDIIGEGPLRDALHARIADLGLEGHVRLLGARTQGALVDELRGAAVTTLPCVIDASGDRDALPTVLIESLAMAVPVVTTTINGCPEIVGEDEAGWLVAPNAPRQLADALAQALLDAHERRVRGQLGRIRCESHFDAQRNACRLARWFAEASLRLPSMKHSTLAN